MIRRAFPINHWTDLDRARAALDRWKKEQVASAKAEHQARMARLVEEHATLLRELRQERDAFHGELRRAIQGVTRPQSATLH